MGSSKMLPAPIPTRPTRPRLRCPVKCSPNSSHTRRTKAMDRRARVVLCAALALAALGGIHRRHEKQSTLHHQQNLAAAARRAWRRRLGRGVRRRAQAPPDGPLGSCRAAHDFLCRNGSPRRVGNESSRWKQVPRSWLCHALKEGGASTTTLPKYGPRLAGSQPRRRHAGQPRPNREGAPRHGVFQRRRTNHRRRRAGGDAVPDAAAA